VTSIDSPAVPLDGPGGPRPWSRFLGGPARFSVRAWRAGTIDLVRDELDRTLGVRLEPCHDKVYAGEPAFANYLPACELRLNSWPSITPGLTVFNFIGLERREGAVSQSADDLSLEVAARLREDRQEWYAPDRNEDLHGGGVLGDRLLDPDEVVAMIAPRWLNWLDAAGRERALEYLRRLADTWVGAALRAPDPVTELTRQWADFEATGGSYRGQPRLALIESYAAGL
jgi:hypothetical protein